MDRSAPASTPSVPLWAWAAVLVLTAVGAWVGASAFQAPSAAAEGFDVDRAFVHVAAVAAAPRPMGAPGHTAAREYLVAQLEALGYETEVQVAPTGSVDGGGLQLATVRNVVARREGPGDRTVLLAAHYDSVPLSPGAGDNGAALGAVLEALRVIEAEGGPEDDVIVLFSDGEEVGLLGARAFVERHRWAPDVDLVVNFDARGASGGAIMFQSAPSDGALIGALGAAASAPIVASATEPLYGLMPNDTDFTVYQEAGLPGYNIAFIGDGHAYHRPNDVVETLSPASVQHQGAYVLDLLRETPAAGGAPAMSYFNLGGRVVALGPGLTLALLVLAVLAGLGAVVWGVRRGGIAGAAVGRGAAAGLGATFVMVAVAVAADFAATELAAEYALVRVGPIYVAGVLALGAGLVLALAARGRAFRMDAGFRLGGLLVWTALAVVLYLLMPRMTYLVAVPLVVAALAAVVWPAGEAAPSGGRFVGAYALGLLPALVLVLPVVGMALVAFSMVPAVAALPTGLALLLAAGHVGALPRKGLLAGGLIAVGALAAGGALASAAGAPSEHPSLIYLQNAGQDDGIWASRAAAPPPWAASLFGDDAAPARLDAYYPIAPFEFMTASAEASGMPGASVEVLRDSVGETTRSVTLRVRPEAEVPVVYLLLRSDLRVEAATVGDLAVGGGDWAPIPAPGGAWYALTYRAMPAEGIDIDLELSGFPDRIGDAVPVMAVAHHYGLPHGVDAVALDAAHGTRPEDTPFMYASIISTARALDGPAPADDGLVAAAD